ncbi:MAG: hypothetical protein H7A46_20350 [Verrucomicrobiales bacterium]|nr:hypothetical protein [Verrucomicrobiales bacterium]
MAHIQELIYQLEVGKGPKIVRVLAASLAVLVLAWWYNSHEFRNFYTAEAMESAQLARNIADGEGFTTKCVRPFSLYLVEQQQGLDAGIAKAPHPDLMTAPGYPVLVAGLMKVLPFHFDIGAFFWVYQPELLMAIANQVLFLLTLWLICGLAARMFSMEVSILTLMFLLASDVLWRFSTSGLSTMLVMFLVTLLVRAVVALDTSCHEGGASGAVVRWAAVAGGLIAAAGLTRYSMLALLVPMVAYTWIFCGRHRLKISVTVVGVTGLLVGGWLWRNYHLSGHLFGLAGFAVDQDSIAFPGNTLERSLNPELALVGLNDYLRKLVVNLEGILTGQLPTLGGSWLGGFFLAGLLLKYRNGVLSRLRFFVLLTLGTLCLTQAMGTTHLSEESPVINSENLLILLAPVLVLYGTAFLSTLLDQMELPIQEIRHFLIVVLLVVAGLPLLLTFLPPRSVPINYPPYYPKWIQDNADLIRQNELMMSDMPWAVAWYGNRQCIWVPRDGPTFYEIQDRHKRVAALYLTQLSSDVRFLRTVIQGRDYDWSRFSHNLIVRGELPPGFPLKDVWSYYMPDQLFLADRPRWSEAARAAAEAQAVPPDLSPPPVALPTVPDVTLPSVPAQ